MARTHRCDNLKVKLWVRRTSKALDGSQSRVADIDDALFLNVTTVKSSVTNSVERIACFLVVGLGYKSPLNNSVSISITFVCHRLKSKKLPAAGCSTSTATFVPAAAIVTVKVVMVTTLAALPFAKCHVNDCSENCLHGLCDFSYYAEQHW